MNRGLQTAAAAEQKKREEVIEPEVVFDGFARREKPAGAPGSGGILTRVRLLASAALMAAGVLLIIPGIILSASLIGALIGIPLILSGGTLLFTGIKIGAGKFTVKTFR